MNGPGYQVYVTLLSKQTGLSPATIARWAQAEGAYAPNGTGGFNYGNLRAKGGGVGYSGVKLAGVSPGGFAQFASPEDAAHETAYWINQMPNYAGVKAAAGRGPDAELAAIAASPWDAGHYKGGFGAGVAPSAAPGPSVAPQQAVQAPPGPDPRTTFALAIAQHIGSHQGLGNLDVGGLLGELHSGLQQRGIDPATGAAAAPGLPQADPVGIVKTALSQIGIPYQWGGPAKLGSSTDCSGLLQASMAAHGVQIPRTTYEQWKTGQPVDAAHLQPGDAVFFDMGKQGPGHVGIYIGGGRMIEDPHTGATVRIADIKHRGMVGARRYVQGQPATHTFPVAGKHVFTDTWGA